MSCVDAAIIRALVEHVGINPDDVQLGQPHECVKYTAGNGINISFDNVISVASSGNQVGGLVKRNDITFTRPNTFDLHVRLTENYDTNDIGIKLYDVIVFYGEGKPAYTFICTSVGASCEFTSPKGKITLSVVEGQPGSMELSYENGLMPSLTTDVLDYYTLNEATNAVFTTAETMKLITALCK